MGLGTRHAAPQPQHGIPEKIVNRIYNAILRTEFFICETYPQLKAFLPEDIHFIHAEELRQRYPDLTPKEREDAICREYGAVFIIGIGGKLEDGKEHDLRAPDYDDYSTIDERSGLAGLNGDLLIWYPILGRAIELSSMGIRVDKETLLRQLQLSGKEDRKNCTSTAACSTVPSPSPSVAASGKAACAWCCSTRHMWEKPSRVSGLRKCAKSAKKPV